MHTTAGSHSTRAATAGSESHSQLIERFDYLLRHASRALLLRFYNLSNSNADRNTVRTGVKADGTQAQ